MKLKYQIPNIYAQILPKDLLQTEIVETKAQCGQCIMAPERKSRAPFYQDHLKCCTFYPYMPNYLVGGILEDKNKLSDDTRSVIEGIISERKYSLPIGFVAPIPYQIAFNARKKSDFGNKEEWLCPYFRKTSNDCGVWRWRGSVCSSFFCASSYGKAGMEFWAEMTDYLHFVEMVLMEEALVQLDFSPRQVSELLEFLNRKTASKQELQAWTLPLAQAKSLWNGYYNEQEKFFLKTLEIVRGFDRKSFKEAQGQLGQKLEDKIQRRAEKLAK